MERELALEFVRVTEAAAIAAGRLMGRGDKTGADQVAVDAMRNMLDSVNIRGTVVIGEGEMDEAPMLYIGEAIGTGDGVPVDIAVDPLEGTNLVSKGMPGAIAVMAVAPAGHLLHAPDMYMEKIITGPAGRGVIDLDSPIEDNLDRLAKSSGKSISDLTAVVLDRERHYDVIRRMRQKGARIKLITDGDVSPAIATGFPESGVDLLIGIGGAPEGVIAAAAIKCLGGEMQARLMPDDDEQRARMQAMGLVEGALLGLDDLVKGQDVLYVATAITDGDIMHGVRYGPVYCTTHSIVMRSRTGTIRFVKAMHRLDLKEGAHGNVRDEEEQAIHG
ncbi:MAG: class II fructose-bisphosphatase [Thermaerobacter sp.]|nr:class II fructose-bisphosphatase [Thermaerobacter sp.]